MELAKCPKDSTATFLIYLKRHNLMPKMTEPCKHIGIYDELRQRDATTVALCDCGVEVYTYKGIPVILDESLAADEIVVEGTSAH